MFCKVCNGKGEIRYPGSKTEEVCFNCQGKGVVDGNGMVGPLDKEDYTEDLIQFQKNNQIKVFRTNPNTPLSKKAFDKMTALADEFLKED